MERRKEKELNMKYCNCVLCGKELKMFYDSNIMSQNFRTNQVEPADKYEFFCDDCNIQIDITVPRRPLVTIID